MLLFSMRSSSECNVSSQRYHWYCWHRQLAPSQRARTTSAGVLLSQARSLHLFIPQWFAFTRRSEIHVDPIAEPVGVLKIEVLVTPRDSATTTSDHPRNYAVELIPWLFSIKDWKWKRLVEREVFIEANALLAWLPDCASWSRCEYTVIQCYVNVTQ